jgi:hypothetical protein
MTYAYGNILAVSDWQSPGIIFYTARSLLQPFAMLFLLLNDLSGKSVISATKVTLVMNRSIEAIRQSSKTRPYTGSISRSLFSHSSDSRSVAGISLILPPPLGAI